ncbi:hypothetical protein ACUTJJ_21140 [Agrobacterium sp. DKPNP3]|uniref:hypothetical protein n=1 Tax=Agrobacterium sp. DKPNP3 TaxID=3457323 RepID=UPI004043AD34
MAEIIPIAAAKRHLRPTELAERMIGPAKVVLFTGVRYEKRDTEPAGKVVRNGNSTTDTALTS